MKRTTAITAVIITMLMVISTVGFGQEFSKMERRRDLAFTKESKVAKIKINVSDEFNFLQITIMSEFAVGEALIEILDPKDEVRGKYTIVADGDIVAGENTKVNSFVSGEMERYYRDPVKGDWMVRITPKNATGNTVIVTTLLGNPRVDLLEIDQIKQDTDLYIK